MMVMMTAMTPSLKAVSRSLFIVPPAPPGARSWIARSSPAMTAVPGHDGGEWAGPTALDRVRFAAETQGKDQAMRSRSMLLATVLAALALPGGSNAQPAQGVVMVRDLSLALATQSAQGALD